MTLSCECNDDADWYFDDPADCAPLVAARPRRCRSCKATIAVGADCYRFRCWRPPNNDIEERIHGDEVPLAFRYMCERCGDLYLSLVDLGFCATLGEDMRELVREYAEHYGRRT